MEIKEIMSQAVVSIHPNESVEVAARTMTQYNIGALPVCANGKLCGMLTDRDIVTRAVSKHYDSCSINVSECMSKSTVCANPEQQVKDAVKTMSAGQVRRVPVVENGNLCGILSLADVSRNGYDAEISCALCEISKP